MSRRPARGSPARSERCCRPDRCDPLSNSGLPAPTRLWQRLADRVLHLGGLAFERVAKAAHLAPEAVELVEQVQHQGQRLVVDREFAADLDDQLDPRDIDLMEQPAPARLVGQDPAVLDPALELDAIERGDAPGQLVNADHEAAALSAAPGSLPIAPRGSVGCFSVQPLMNSASSASPLAPIITLSVTYWSPVVSLPRRRRRMPLPRSRSRAPVSEPGGIAIVTGPVTVGTGTRAPSTASARLTGSSTWMSSPSRRKNGCGAICTSISASPGGPPPKPGLPLPFKRST